MTQKLRLLEMRWFLQADIKGKNLRFDFKILHRLQSPHVAEDQTLRDEHAFEKHRMLDNIYTKPLLSRAARLYHDIRACAMVLLEMRSHCESFAKVRVVIRVDVS